jgi:calcineurin-like phosphoesterase family protein
VRLNGTHRCDKLNEYIKLGLLDKIKFISDTHFWHKNIIQYCNRPFASVEEMNETMWSNWKNGVRPDDIIIHVGDVMFGANSFLDTMNEKLSNLPGHKILVVGNHDYNRSHKLLSLFFDEVYKEIRFKVDDLNIRITHVPIAWSDLPDSVVNIHGHIHNHLVKNVDEGRYFNACVEHHEYGPVSLPDLLFQTTIQE